MATYRLNHVNCLHITTDIRCVDAADVMSCLGLHPRQLTLLAGCPPCQGFTTLKTLNGSRSLDHPMNDLIFAFHDFIQVMQPHSIMIENVPGLFHDSRIGEFRDDISRVGYRSDAAIFDASDYGVPQRRQRMILLAHRGERVVFAKPDANTPTVRQAIADMPPPGAGSDSTHDYIVKRRPEVEHRIRMIPKDGGSRRDLGLEGQLPCHKRTRGFYDIYGRMKWSAPAPTLTTGCTNPSKGRFLHPDQDRSITIREAAILQGFPRDYMFDTSCGREHAARMIGNAFPPPFARAHAATLLAQLPDRGE